jgi:hypothetical protein
VREVDWEGVSHSQISETFADESRLPFAFVVLHSPNRFADLQTYQQHSSDLCTSSIDSKAGSDGGRGESGSSVAGLS